MARIPTPIPKSLVRLTKRAFTGRTLDTIWKAGVLVLLFVVGLGFLAAGPVGYLVGGIILATLLDDAVRNAVRDLWNRNFWVFRP